MLSAQINEKDSNVEPSAQEPKLKVPSGVEPEGPKGSAARKWIVLLVIVAVVGAAVWKIRRNAKEQDSVVTPESAARRGDKSPHSWRRSIRAK